MLLSPRNCKISNYVLLPWEFQGHKPLKFPTSLDVLIVRPRFATFGPSFLGIGCKNGSESRRPSSERPTIFLRQGDWSLWETAQQLFRNSPPAWLQEPSLCTAHLWCTETSDDSPVHTYVQFPPYKKEKETRPNTIKETSVKILVWDVENLTSNPSSAPVWLCTLRQITSLLWA